MTLADLADAARARHLAIRAALHPTPEDPVPDGCKTLVLLGPDEPGAWHAFKAAPEMQDGAPDPLDRWSKRQIAPLAERFGGTAIFPADGPPYAPFIRWALASGHIWTAPIGLLVHGRAGLFTSFRGALALPDRLALPEPETSPCTGCAAPCRTACPVKALTPDGYDVPTCKAHVAAKDGADCRSGCLVRRACPVSQSFGRLPEQSRFHMAAFMGRAFAPE